MWTPGMEEPIEVPLEMEVTKEDVNFMEKFWQGWTPTAIELWNDKKFIEKRIEEQISYGINLWRRWNCGDGVDDKRYSELWGYAVFILEKFEKRLEELELNSGVA